MGMVFRAEDPGLARILALKVMLPAVASVPENRQRFLREAQATALVNHPNVIPIYKIGEDRGVPFLAMPLLKGELLETRINRERRLTIPDSVRIGREIAAGLAAAHDRNLIHRDIKPANLWLEAIQRRGVTDRVKILDFGLARIGDAGFTTPGAVLGTPAYMAPEQAKGQPVDYRCDLFSLGSVLYRLVTGERAFKGNEVFAVLMALTTEHPVAPHELNPEVPPALSQLIMHLLAKNPDDRPQSAHEVVSKLNALGPSGTSSTDRLPIYGAGSSGSIPVTPSPDDAKASSPNGPATAADSQTGAGPRSLSIGVWAAIILLICLLAFWLQSLFVAKPRGTVQLQISPPGSEVLIDSGAIQLNGDGATTMALAPGKHEMKVLHKDYHGRTLTLEVKEGDNLPVNVELKKLQLGAPVTTTTTAEPKPETPPVKEPAPEQKPAPQPPPKPVPELRLEAAKDPVLKQADAKPPTPNESRPKKEAEAKTASKTNDSPPETAPVKVMPRPVIAIDRRAAMWVIDCGGFVVLKRPGRETGDRVSNRDELPRGRFDVVQVNLRKKQKVDDEGLAALESLKELSTLDLSGTSVTDRGIAKLQSLRSLTILDVRDTAITDRAIADFRQLNGLQSLDLQNTKISPAGLQQIRAALPRCQISEP
jgi:serine/threonine protein kinase